VTVGRRGTRVALGALVVLASGCSSSDFDQSMDEWFAGFFRFLLIVFAILVALVATWIGVSVFLLGKGAHSIGKAKRVNGYRTPYDPVPAWPPQSSQPARAASGSGYVYLVVGAIVLLTPSLGLAWLVLGSGKMGGVTLVVAGVAIAVTVARRASVARGVRAAGIASAALLALGGCAVAWTAPIGFGTWNVESSSVRTTSTTTPMRGIETCGARRPACDEVGQQLREVLDGAGRPLRTPVLTVAAGPEGPVVATFAGDIDRDRDRLVRSILRRAMEDGWTRVDQPPCTQPSPFCEPSFFDPPPTAFTARLTRLGLTLTASFPADSFSSLTTVALRVER
jgi:hypothetical protein